MDQQWSESIQVCITLPGTDVNLIIISICLSFYLIQWILDSADSSHNNLFT